ncbi:TPA: hypothetical protein DCQ44_03275 [Candidatus Taylorbacteria bacterium]|nr:hypothetical protein [Candidatus Taylorbacteria bacterium]
MFSFLNNVLADLKGISNADIKGPSEKARDGEGVVTTLKDIDLRKLFTLRTQLTEKLKALSVVAMKEASTHRGTADEHNVSTCPNCRNIQKMAPLAARIEGVNDLLWAGVRTELNETEIAEILQNGRSIGLRQGWKIVSIPHGGATTIISLDVPVDVLASLGIKIPKQ